MRIGTAGWAIRKEFSDLFSGPGSHLERYAKVFNAVELNSSFYRDHQAATYERWANAVPEDFRFSVKLNRLFTHQNKLEVNGQVLFETLHSVLRLGRKLGCLLVQLPPSLSFEI